ncbi:energy transducer TonB [Selenomonas sp. F0473]|uniref:energy transducer TonB n=1 Tax=Selenomonas sp. F0473 TaxID=999423 RepID=UPI00029E04F8|nr:energy transducer TonB [Selenomonas sp. F0473]EKU70779.1 TonB family domain-containing protein [Selenomonas sp. F0473]
MDITEKEKCISWGASFGIHVCLLIAAAAMGLFTVAATPEKRPIDVEIYDAAAPASDPAPAAQAAAPPPPPSIDDIQFEKPKQEVEPRPQQEQPRETPRQTVAAGNSNAPVNSTGTSNTSSSSTGSTGGGGDGNSSGRDAAAAQRPKVPPKFLSGATPVYPPDLERKGITGTVGVSLIVGADGSVQSASVSSPSGQPALDQAALNAAYTYRFAPARNIYDEPVACRINRSFSFS